MPTNIWYRNYKEINLRVKSLECKFEERCKQLKKNTIIARMEFNRDIIHKIVFESNWQEGIQLNPGRTKELSSEAFDKIDSLTGPHIDMGFLSEEHRKEVHALKRKGASLEEIAAYNLSKSHYFLALVNAELLVREGAAVMQKVQRLEQMVKEIPEAPDSLRVSMGELISSVNDLRFEDFPEIKGWPKKSTDLYTQLMALEPSVLIRPLKAEHVHFLHRTVLTGILPPSRCGLFRRKSVHIEGNPDLTLPPASMVNELMSEFCEDFPGMVVTGDLNYDLIMSAAKISHRFTQIHPYLDGNGRVSRLLMNLILGRRHPVVYLKATNSKGRQRYRQALQRADRKNIEPLAALIALSVEERYQQMLSALGEKTT